MQWVSTAEKANVTALAIDSATMEIQVLGSFFGDLYYTDSTGVRPNLPHCDHYRHQVSNRPFGFVSA